MHGFAKKRIKGLHKEEKQLDMQDPKRDMNYEEYLEVVQAWMRSKQREQLYQDCQNDFEVIFFLAQWNWILFTFYVKTILQDLTYASARNFIILELMISSLGPRPQILKDMTCKDVWRCKQDEIGFAIPVSQHKTGFKGKAYITIDDHRLMDILM